ncbi:unnamed protein product, partial [marine sediment metagenome]
MNFGKNGPLGGLKKHIIIIYIALTVIVLLTLFTDVFRTSEAGSIPQLVWLLCALILMIAVITMLFKAFRILDALEANGTKLERINESLEKIRADLSQVNQSSRLSGTAKAILFRDTERQSLREAVFDKLQQQDFDTTYEIIDEIARSTEYQ